MSNRKGLIKSLISRFGLENLRRCYRSKNGVLIYTTEDFSNIFVDLPKDDEYFQSDLGNALIDEKTVLPYVIPNYLRIVKVLLRNDKLGRTVFNDIVKSNFVFAGHLFGEFFTTSGNLDFNKIVEVSECSKEILDYAISDEINNSEWGGYNPYKDRQLNLLTWLSE